MQSLHRYFSCREGRLDAVTRHRRRQHWKKQSCPNGVLEGQGQQLAQGAVPGPAGHQLCPKGVTGGPRTDDKPHCLTHTGHFVSIVERVRQRPVWESRLFNTGSDSRTPEGNQKGHGPWRASYIVLYVSQNECPNANMF